MARLRLKLCIRATKKKGGRKLMRALSRWRIADRPYNLQFWISGFEMQESS
jgi:hypothetical protein